MRCDLQFCELTRRCSHLTWKTDYCTPLTCALWRIQDFRSGGGGATLGVPEYDFIKFALKLHEIVTEFSQNI